jgi:hypothetical protein
MYASHLLTNKSNKEIKEATPYQFEKDRFIEGYNEAIQHQRQQLYKMYKGKVR